MKHPPCSQDLAPSGYLLFLKLKKCVKVRKFSHDGTNSTVFQWLDVRFFFWKGQRNLRSNVPGVLNFRGENVE